MTKPIVASYCTTFLKPEMLHIYRQVVGLRNFDTYILTKKRLHVQQYPFKNIEIIPRPKKNFVRRFYLKHVRKEPPIVYRGEFQTLFKIVRKRPTNLMHIYFGHTAVHLLPFILEWDKPIVVSFHGADVMLREEQPEYAEGMRTMLKKIPLIMARSESLRDRIIALGADPEKIRINRTGIPLDSFPFLKREVPVGEAWHFVQACRLIPKKGIPTALRAFQQFYQSHPNARFTIAGEGPMKRELKILAEELGISQAVVFLGFLQQKELNALFREGHIFIHPSELTADQNQEGIPNSMLEAMSTGLPVLATLHGGIPEAVDSEKTGILVEERDVDGLYRAMERLTGDVALWRSMGDAASVAMHENFEHKAQIEKLESYYREVL